MRPILSRLSRFATPLIPPAAPGWPNVLYAGPGRRSEDAHPQSAAQDALRALREDFLWWPVHRHDAGATPVYAASRRDLSAALKQGWKRPDIATGPAQTVRPKGLWAIFAAGDPVISNAARLAFGPQEDALALLRGARAVCPWRGSEFSLEEGIGALILLRKAARANARGVRFHGMGRWKRDALRPFFHGPHGPGGSAPQGAVDVGWGAGGEGVRVEDGFLRSVGLGLRHTPPCSITADPLAPYFDATRRNAFDAVVEGARFDDALCARAARLRARLVALNLTKYNLASSRPPAVPKDRMVVLAPGQVAKDASIQLGARQVTTNAGLLKAARRLYPDAYIIYKPHPEVLTGLRPGAVPDASAADHVETGASAADCLAIADRVVTITSLMGFEALLRGVPVATLGRPFYAGWGLTEDCDPPDRPRELTLDELTAAALILYPRYIDPVTRLPAPVELVVERLAEQAARRDAPAARALKLWRDGMSWPPNFIESLIMRRKWRALNEGRAQAAVPSSSAS